MRFNAINILSASMVCLLFSCKKENVDTPSFEVTAGAATYKAGDTVEFRFSGDPDVISFYSGESGSQYKYSNRTTADGTASLQFSTFAQNSGAQANSLKLMVSQDFKGAYTTDGISAATWTDITSRAVLSTGTDNVSSGTLDLSDVLPAGKPAFLAFRKYDANSATLKPRAWTIRSFNLNLITADSTYAVATIANAGWKAVDVLNTTYKWTIGTAALSIGGGAVNTPENEDWVITKAIVVNGVNPDRAQVLKTWDVVAPQVYRRVYNKPGVYKVAFIGTNVNARDQQSVVKELTITIQ
jgi:hypothetical protein